MHDIIVVGAGPAGMTAALYALRNGKSVLIIEKEGFGGQMTLSPKIENYPGTVQISGMELADQMMNQIIEQGVDFEIEEVTGITQENGTFTVSTDDGEHQAKAVIIATGVKHRMLGLEGEDDLVGDGISFCAVCDGDFYTDKVVCVAGGGNSALQEAVLLATKCKEVIMLQDLEFFTGEERLQEVLFANENVSAHTNTLIKSLVTGKDGLRGVEIADRTTGESQVVGCDGLFVAIGLIPDNIPYAELADLNDWGYFDSDENCTTKTPGLFVAGDCRSKSIRQITTASGDGAVAALAACRYINLS
ncbi:Thioredoxin reductase [Slackia heliotrinireducens]|uniref:Thioredoxin reductase n=1 Tax=Slackia heliotrinireducens (strain ATCC 29202 / DSM 20476 / NCTC 11029 / RHS 1) TaxID=471855 RepID=C7N7G3_SLAHD|nr:FAD-dependent oxidoreductase [Slackia heliotrinireducens]ACV22848.1 thioredoxin reductase [Slackia heliotrinireducens DSM 20476]VEH01597.1 Thioredoxin reductase [Slackia heliotrinireducens]